MSRLFHFSVFACLSLALAVNVDAQLTVDVDLGTLALGEHNVVGTAESGTNEVDYYAPTTNPAGNWGWETVYQFTTTEEALFNIRTNAITGDPDFLLLTDLTTGVDAAGKTFADSAIGNFFLDIGPPETGAPVLIPPGTYYVSATTWWGADGAVIQAPSTFNIDIILEEFVPATPPTPVSDLGVIADDAVPFLIDTLASTQIADTELAVFDEDGFLIITNDDAAIGGTFLSELDLFVGLPAGNYFLAVTGWDTVFGDFFTTNSTSAEFGEYTLNYNGQTLTGNLAAGAVDFYSFSIGGEVILGDCDLNGTVNFFDIQPFIDVLSSNTFLPQADCNEDGVVDFFDIQAFIDILSGV